MRYVVLGASSLALLSGCDWFDSSTPVSGASSRPAAERQVAPSNALPSSGSGRQYDAADTPVDETLNGPRIGSIVADKGGQKAQLEGAAKETAERDKVAREERERRAKEVAERNAQQAKEAPTVSAVPPSAPIASTKVSPEESAIPSSRNVTPPVETTAMPLGGSPQQKPANVTTSGSAQEPSSQAAASQPVPPPPQPAPEAQAARVPAPAVQPSPPPGPQVPEPPKRVESDNSLARSPKVADAPPAASATPKAILATIRFANQSTTMTEAGRAELARVAKSLKGSRQIEIRGYAGGDDPAGARKLALSRALLIRSYLLDQGVSAKMEIANANLPVRNDGSTEYVDIVVSDR
jgi:outer membrane protein OmpA-like peptidoglycan-associated protein